MPARPHLRHRVAESLEALLDLLVHHELLPQREPPQVRERRRQLVHEVEDGEAVHRRAPLGELEVRRRPDHLAVVEVARVLRRAAADDDARLLVRLEPVEHGVEHGAAGVVEEEVDALGRQAVELRADALVVRLVVDCAVESERFLEEGALLLAARDADNLGARALRKLRRDRAHRAGGRGDDDRLALARRLRHAEEADVSRDSGRQAQRAEHRAQRHARQLHRREDFGRRLGGAEPRVGLRAKHAHHARADLELLGIRRDHGAHPDGRQHAAEGGRAVKRRLVKHRAEEGVDREQLHLNEHLVSRQLVSRHAHTLQRKVLGAHDAGRPRFQGPALAGGGYGGRRGGRGGGGSE